MNVIELYLIEIQKNDISLSNLSVDDYYKKLPQDKKHILYNPKLADYYILVLNNKFNAGITGLFPGKSNKKIGFFQIYIEKQYRGKGILKIAANLIFQKYNLSILVSTIKKSNVASIKAHIKAGFKELDKEQQDRLIKKGLQKKDEVRYVYKG